MTIRVMIPKEITEYQEKILFGLSIRQLGFLSLTIALGIGTHLLCTVLLGLTNDITGNLILIEALPLMALGFVKNKNMPLEKYIALYVRHAIGTNKLSYKTALTIDYLPDPENKEAKGREGRYAWIPNRETKKGASECANHFKITKKSRARKRKAALLTIKTARKESRRIKRQYQKEAKSKRGAEINDRFHPLYPNDGGWYL